MSRDLAGTASNGCTLNSPDTTKAYGLRLLRSRSRDKRRSYALRAESDFRRLLNVRRGPGHQCLDIHPSRQRAVYPSRLPDTPGDKPVADHRVSRFQQQLGL